MWRGEKIVRLASVTDSKRAETLDVAGVLGAAVAHELRNMLASASSSIFLARRDVDNRDKLLGHLDSAEAEMHHAQDVIDRVLRLVRGEPIYREPCLVIDSVGLARRNVLGLTANFDVEVNPLDLQISAEPILLERLLTNLIANASDALGNSSSGHIIVRVWLDERGVTLEVEDNGTGIDPTIAERIFEPGVTTKATGTGLGLPLCRAIARAHGGDLLVVHAPAGGTIVRCFFPSPLST